MIAFHTRLGVAGISICVTPSGGSASRIALTMVGGDLLAIGVAYACRISHDAVMREHRRVDRIQFRGIDVRADHPLLEIIEHHVLAAPAKGAPRLLVQP